MVSGHVLLPQAAPTPHPPSSSFLVAAPIHSLVLAQLGHTVTAVDFSKAGHAKCLALAAAEGCADRVQCVTADVTTFQPESPASADSVVMSFCHLEKESKQGVLGNVVAWLKPGGRDYSAKAAAMFRCAQPLDPEGSANRA